MITGWLAVLVSLCLWMRWLYVRWDVSAPASLAPRPATYAGGGFSVHLFPPEGAPPLPQRVPGAALAAAPAPVLPYIPRHTPWAPLASTCERPNWAVWPTGSYPTMGAEAYHGTALVTDRCWLVLIPHPAWMYLPLPIRIADVSTVLSRLTEEIDQLAPVSP